MAFLIEGQPVAPGYFLHDVQMNLVCIHFSHAYCMYIFTVHLHILMVYIYTSVKLCRCLHNMCIIKLLYIYKNLAISTLQ